MENKITTTSWPRHKVKQIEVRKRDLVIRIANWFSDKEEPAIDVEIYHKGIYDWNQSECFALSSGITKKEAKQQAIQFAQKKIAELL